MSARRHGLQASGRPVVLAAAALALVGCAAVPDKPTRAPALVAPAAFAHAGSVAAAAEPVAAFWQRFADPTLDAVMALALAGNLDLRIAAARLAEARALQQGSNALGKPTLSADAAAGRSRSGGSASNRFGLGIGAEWEIDLFGVVTGEQRAAAATVRASQADLRAAQVALAAEVAATYLQLRGLQAQRAVAARSLETQMAALRLVLARVEAGRGTALDSERGRNLVATTAAQLPALDAAVQASRIKLAVLCGQAPGAASGAAVALSALDRDQALPGLPVTALTAVGDPASLLRRRPDVAAAEARLLAADATGDAARGRFWPQLKLAGSLGLNAGRLGDLGRSQAFVFDLGAQLVWSFLDQGAKAAAVSAADARSEAAAAAFDKAVLVALQDTETALSGYTRAQRSSELLFEAEAAADKAARIARARFDVGASDFGAVLEAERELLAARDRLAQAQTTAATGLVQVYRALAGGWGG